MIWIRDWLPSLWRIVAGALLFVAGYFHGVHQESARQRIKADAAASIQLAQARESALEQERLMARSLAAIAENHRKELIDAKTDRDRFIAGVRAGTIRLSIPVAACRGNAEGANPAPAAGNRHEARAELAPEAGATLAAIADDGDDGIRQLNRCIDAYNAVMEAVNVQAQ